jgi:hypothetical protein
LFAPGLLAASAGAQQLVDLTLPSPGAPPITPPTSSLSPSVSWLDDFNRPNAPTLGPDWTENAGTFAILNNRGTSGGTPNSWAQHNSANVPNYTSAVATIDFFPPQTPAITYVALMLGLGGGDNVFLKVQVNGASQTYNTVGLYRGVNGGPWPTGGMFAGLATPTSSGRMTCYFTNNGDTAVLEIDNNFDGIVDEQFQGHGLLSWNPGLGPNFGIGCYGPPEFDDWTASDGSSTPPIVNYCTAGTSTNGCVPALVHSGTPSASATSGFTITATNLEGQKNGLLFYGISGQVALPWGSGSTSFLCVKPPTQRTPPQSSGGTLGQCDGAIALDFLAFMAANPGALGQPIAAGQQYNAQGWYRDPPAVKATNLTDGLEFVLAP